MPQRLAAVMSLLAFAVCLVIGGVGADNPFTTTVERALAAMSGTFVVALVAGYMAQKMIEENVRAAEKAATAEKLPADQPADDR
jgi:hypothetical protein